MGRWAASVAALERLAARAEERPLDHIRWLPGQHRFLSSPSKRKLYRTGNQHSGKTTAGLAELHYRCIGAHPFIDVPPAPITAWVVCASWDQSLAVQTKLAELIPAAELHPECTFDPGKGWKGKWPLVRYANGSIIRIKTTRQGGLRLSAATIDVAMFDEPPETSRIYGEVQKRVMRRNGTILMTLTPINAPVDWLKETVEQGQIEDHHVRLTPENMIPVGTSAPLRLDDGTPMDQTWIDRIVEETLPMERPVVLHGEWECRVEGRVFRAFDDTTHKTTAPPRGQCKIALGIDYGDGADFSQVVILCAVDDSGLYPRVWVLDEYVSDGTSTIDQDARAILVMLRRHNMKWRSVDRPHGDRVYDGRRGGISKKSNADMMRALARELQLTDSGLQPRIRTVKRGKGHGRGSVDHGCRFLHQSMVRPAHFHIHPRCGRLINSIMRWDYRDSEWKHAIDGLRYALHPWIFAKERRGPVPELRFG